MRSAQDRVGRIIVAVMLAGGLAGCLAGGYYAWGLREGRIAVEQGRRRIDAALGAGGGISYAAYRIHPFSGSASFDHPVLRLADGTVCTAVVIEVRPGRRNRIAALYADAVRLVAATHGAAGGVVVTAATLDGHGITLPATGGSAATASFDRLRLGGVSMQVAGSGFAARVDVGSISATSDGAVRSAVEADGLRIVNAGSSPLQVGRLALAGRPDGADTRVTLRVGGIVYAPVEQAGRQALRDALGIDRVTGAMSLEERVDKAAGTLSIAMLRLEADRLATLTLAMDLTGIDFAPATGTPGVQAMRAITGMALVGARISLIDDGLIGDASNARGARIGVSGAVIRGRLADAVRTSAMRAALPNGAAMAMALADFLARGGTLTLSMRPASPVVIGNLAAGARTDPIGTVTRLGLSLDRTP
jgi:hypothetical protein